MCVCCMFLFSFVFGMCLVFWSFGRDVFVLEGLPHLTLAFLFFLLFSLVCVPEKVAALLNFQRIVCLFLVGVLLSFYSKPRHQCSLFFFQVHGSLLTHFL